MHLMERPHLPIIELQASGRLAALLGAAHLLTLILVVTLPLPTWMQWCGAALLLLSAAQTVFRHALRRGRDAVTALAFDDRVQLRARTRDGVWHTGRVVGSSTVTAVLTVLNLRFDGCRRPVHVLIAGDSLSADDFRRLRVWLRWGPQPAADDVAVAGP